MVRGRVNTVARATGLPFLGVDLDNVLPASDAR